MWRQMPRRNLESAARLCYIEMSGAAEAWRLGLVACNGDNDKCLAFSCEFAAGFVTMKV